MKTTCKYLLAMLIIISISTGAFALDFGLKVGLQCQDTFKRIDGYKVGAFISIPLKPRLSLQTEAHFSTLHINYAGESLSSGSLWNFIMHSDTVRYLEVPVMLKYTLNPKGKFRPLVFAGAYASFRLNKNPDYKNADSIFITASTPREYNSAEGGLLFGIGFERRMRKTFYTFDIRFNYGLTTARKLYSNSAWESIQPVFENNNRVISFMLGFGF